MDIKIELTKLQKVVKIYSARKIFRKISLSDTEVFSNPSFNFQTPVSSDELLPWLIQALLNCQIFNLYSQLDYMSKFQLSSDDKVLLKFFLLKCYFHGMNVCNYSVINHGPDC